MSGQRILIAGIGNIFLGDDAFGVEVAQALVHHPLPEGVEVRDFGIRSFDLAYALLEDYNVSIMVDAMPRGGEAGTLYLLEPDLNEFYASDQHDLEAHSMNPMVVLQLVKTLGGQPNRVLVLGCEPATFGPENEGQLGLSEPVQAAIPRAIEMIERFVADWFASQDQSKETLSLNG